MLKEYRSCVTINMSLYYTVFTIQIQPSRLPRGGGPTRGRAVFADDSPPPPNRGKIPPLRTRGIIDPLTWGVHRGLVVGVFHCRLTGRQFESALYWSTLTSPPPVVHDWVYMSRRVCVTRHIKILSHLSKSRALCSGGRFPPRPD